MTVEHQAQLRERAQSLLDQWCNENKVPCTLRVKAQVKDEAWLYLVVEPSTPGVNSEDFVSGARWVEEKLATSPEGEQVLLVPARSQD